MMKFSLRLMMLMALGWIVCANVMILDKVATVLSSFNHEIGLKAEMCQYATFLKIYYIDHDELPQCPHELIRDCLRENGRAVNRDTGKDHWGNLYRFFRTEGGFHIVSAGPDHKWKTEDDVRFFQNLKSLGY